MPGEGARLAALAGEPALAGDGRGPGVPAAAGAALSAAAAGREGGPRYPNRRAAERGRDAVSCADARPFPRARGSAPSIPIREFFRRSLPPARLLRALPAATTVAGAAFLLRPVPTGLTARARPRGQVAQPTAARLPAPAGAVAGTAGAVLRMSHRIARGRSRRVISPDQGPREGAGGRDREVLPPFPSFGSGGPSRVRACGKWPRRKSKAGR
jgi:hypothetical protein